MINFFKQEKPFLVLCENEDKKTIKVEYKSRLWTYINKLSNLILIFNLYKPKTCYNLKKISEQLKEDTIEVDISCLRDEDKSCLKGRIARKFSNSPIEQTHDKEVFLKKIFPLVVSTKSTDIDDKKEVSANVIAKEKEVKDNDWTLEDYKLQVKIMLKSPANLVSIETILAIRDDIIKKISLNPENSKEDLIEFDNLLIESTFFYFDDNNFDDNNFDDTKKKEKQDTSNYLSIIEGIVDQHSCISNSFIYVKQMDQLGKMIEENITPGNSHSETQIKYLFRKFRTIIAEDRKIIIEKLIEIEKIKIDENKKIDYFRLSTWLLKNLCNSKNDQSKKVECDLLKKLNYLNKFKTVSSEKLINVYDLIAPEVLENLNNYIDDASNIRDEDFIENFFHSSQVKQQNYAYIESLLDKASQQRKEEIVDLIKNERIDRHLPEKESLAQSIIEIHISMLGQKFPNYLEFFKLFPSITLKQVTIHYDDSIISLFPEEFLLNPSRYLKKDFKAPYKQDFEELLFQDPLKEIWYLHNLKRLNSENTSWDQLYELATYINYQMKGKLKEDDELLITAKSVLLMNKYEGLIAAKFLRDKRYISNFSKEESTLSEMMSDRDLREQIHVNLIERLENAELRNYNHLFKLATTIITNKENLFLENGSPLEQTAIRVLIQCNPNALENSSNPYYVYNVLAQNRKEPLCHKYTDKHSQSSSPQKELYAWNLDNFREKAEVSNYTIADLPDVDLNTIKNIFDRLEERLNPQIANCIEGSYHHPLKSLKERLLNNDVINKTLIKTNKINPVTFQLYSLIKMIADTTDKLEPDNLLSPQECMLFSFANVIENCSVGQTDGIQRFYQLCSKTVVKSQDTQNIAYSFVDKCVRQKMEEVFVNSSFLKDIGGVELVNTQAAHATLYAKNRMAHQIGLNHPLTFDPHTQVLSQELLNQSIKDLVKTYFNYFTVEDLTQEMVKQSEEFFKNKSAYKHITDLLETQGEIDYQAIIDYDENNCEPKSLTVVGAIELLKATGYLEVKK